ncbi:transposable element Tc1 transposase [Trichonephila clavipes]|nr:transposable element Tc1 transposase [Trichonephila clavipes]
MVWNGIMINGRTRLHVVANGTMTGQRYIDEVLLPHVRLFRGAVGDKFVLMDDNATFAGRNYPPTNKNTLIRALTEEWDKLPQQLLDNIVQNTTNLEVIFPNTPTIYGYNSSNTLDFALISNFNFPYNIESISELFFDHNPVILSFTLTSTIHKHNPRAITTCWSAFSRNLKNQIHLSDFSKINSPQSLEEKLTKFTDLVSSAHNSASKPITNKRHSYTPQHIKDLIARKNRARKLSQRTLKPLHKTEANRLQGAI